MRLLVVGAGGHAKVVVDAALAAGLPVVAAAHNSGENPAVTRVLVTDDPAGVEADSFVVAVGDNRTRARLFAEWTAAGLKPITVIHPSAVLASDAVIGAGTFVAAGVIVNSDARIAENSILNTGCTVDHDCVIGAHVHIAPGTNLSGAVTVGEGALLGVGSCATMGASIGAWSIIGAGAAVVCDLPANKVCFGVPARPVREVDEG